MIQDFITLLFPRNCIACGESLLKHEDQLCNYCYLNLPKSNFHEQQNNPIATLFYGRSKLQMASSFYLFHKKGVVQKILHEIKYKNNNNLATLIGKWYAQDLLNNDIIKSADYIVPIPLHRKKLKIRGYNQSEEFAKGLSEGLNIPLNNSVLFRKSYTETQTKKSKYERWENVENVFELNATDIFNNKHVIIVDDVITTGATIEACIQLLNKIEGIKISVLSIAYADK